MVRSRTGCLTCRKRKLKCDEGKPACGQCRRANRQCEPSSGLTFRHQHNASMNADVLRSPSSYTLGSFYNYRKAFDNTATWVDIPKGEHLFINTSNPYDDPPSPNGHGQGARGLIPCAQMPLDPFQDSLVPQELSPMPHTRGLEVLSEAAVFSPPKLNLTRLERLTSDQSFDPPPDPPTPSAAVTTSSSPHGSISARTSGVLSASIDAIPHPISALESPIDPNLMSPPDRQDMTSSNTGGTSPALIQEAGISVESELDHKEAFLLRHFSELPGRWMDLFDFGCYFGSIVPVQARTYPLLKHSICAYAAKQLFRASTQKAIVGGITSRQATMEIYDEPVEWEVEATIHYGKAVSLLQGLVAAAMDSTETEALDRYLDFLESSEDFDMQETEQLRLQKNRAKEKLQEEEVVAASTILGIYEFVSATGPAWSRHLNGTKLLLDLAQPQQAMPATETGILVHSMSLELPTSEGRKAAFWQLARQDYLAAFINECRTRLDTEDLALWQKNGLCLSSDGLVMASKMIEIQGMQECMFANALIWLSSKICNFIAAGESSEAVPPGDRSETFHFEKHPGKYAESQAFLLGKWKRLQYELEHWFEALPPSFVPSARMKPREAIFEEHERLTELTDKARKFEEIWFAKSMCAATMQHYHMARILLLLNKPHESTARRTTLGRRFHSMRSISEECVYHCYQIIGISLSRPDSAARIHSTQPLFVAGHCLTNRTERRIIIDLLKGIEKDLGWATEHRVQQLQLEWDWTEETTATSKSKASSIPSKDQSDLLDPLKWRF